MKRLKFFIAIILIISILPVNLCFAQERKIKILIDGKELKTDVNPISVNGRVLIPMRPLFEALGATLQWDPAKKSITCLKGDLLIITLWVGKDECDVNGETRKIDVPPLIKNNRTYVPVRFVSQTLTYNVDWNSNAQIVSVNKPSKPTIIVGDLKITILQEIGNYTDRESSFKVELKNMGKSNANFDCDNFGANFGRLGYIPEEERPKGLLKPGESKIIYLTYSDDRGKRRIIYYKGFATDIDGIPITDSWPE